MTTVEDLIEALQAYPPNTEVVIWKKDWGEVDFDLKEHLTFYEDKLFNALYIGD